MIALVDCNNFYVSCERVIDPSLNGRPVAVLSNNDGVVISRSNEVKALGVPMAAPAFKYKDVFEKNKVVLISGNFSYYNVISQQVKGIVSDFTPDIEDYSVDEVFLSLTGRLYRTPIHQMQIMRNRIFEETGIPVSVGIARTKTLSKVAAEFVKTHPDSNGVMSLYDAPNVNDYLQQLPVGNIWGIGRQLSALLQENHINTALDLAKAQDLWVLKHLHINGLKTVHELRGIPSIAFESSAAPPKQIMRSRSFGRTVTTLSELKEATAFFTSMAAESLRAHNLVARNIGVFVMTNRFNSDPKYSNSRNRRLPEASAYTPELIAHSHELLENIFREGYRYNKVGVVLTELSSAQSCQLEFSHDEKESERNEKMMRTLDTLNGKYQNNFLLSLAAQGIAHGWRSKQENLTTTAPVYNDPKSRVRFMTTSTMPGMGQ